MRVIDNTMGKYKIRIYTKVGKFLMHITLISKQL